MNNLLFKTSLRYLLQHPWQVGLSILGVALGVAVVVAIDVANASAKRAFTLSTATITGETTHQIVANNASGVDETVYRDMVLSGVAPRAAPIVDSYVTPANAALGPIQLLGVSPFAETGFRAFSGNLVGNQQELGVLLAEPRTGIVSEEMAQRAGVGVGGELGVVINGRRDTVKIVGLIRSEDELNRRALDGVLITDISTAQELLDQVGRVSRIDLIVPPDAAGEQQLAAIRERLPRGVELTTPATRTQAIEQLSRAFETNLTALSLLALVVGMFLIYNTVTFSVVQRRGLLGTLRCIGVTRREIFTLILSEAAILGAIGAALGVGLGLVLGSGLVSLVTQTINDLYFVVNVRGLFITPATLLKGIGLGLGTTLITAAVPAYEAGSTPPRTVLRRSSVEERIRRAIPLVTIGGVILLIIGSGILLLPTRSLWISFGGLFAIVFGCALLTPGATLLLMSLVRPLGGRLFGLLGRMAARDVVAALSRTSVAIAALMIAMSVTVGVGIMVGSFRQTVIDWLNTSLVADIYVSPPGVAANRPDAILNQQAIDTLRSAPGVQRSQRYRNIDVRSGSNTVRVIAVDVIDQTRAYSLVPGTADSYDAAFTAFQNGAVMVSQPFAYRFNLPDRGGTVTLDTDHGPHTFNVAGIFYDYASDQGSVVMPLPVFQQFWDDRAISSLALYAAPDADVDALARDLQNRISSQQEILIRSNRGLREETLIVFDRTFAITSVLQLLATVIAFVGILSALMALQLERAKELGVMRANGLTPRQLWGVVLGQTGLMGVTAGLLSLPVGLVVALVLVYVINRRSFGWTLQVIYPPNIFVQAVLLALVAALLAGVYPAIRMARTAPALALREE